MAYSNGLSQQQMAKIFSKIIGQAESAMEATLKNTIDEIIKNIDNYWLGRGALDYRGVTGNAYTSVTLGLYHKNKLVYTNWNGKHAEPPTQRSLAAGEHYKLPTFYDGDSTEKKPFTGKYGIGGEWGPQLAPWSIYSQRYNKGFKGNDWTVVVAIPVEYAGYNKKIVKALQNIMDDMPSVVDYKTVRVENAPQQTSLGREYLNFDPNVPF